MPTANTSDFRNGLCLEYNSDIFQIIEFQHVKPGKGAAFVRTKLKSLTNGRVLENTFPAGAKVETARIERRKYQYLYPDETGYVFMHTETFDQIPIEGKLIGDQLDLLKEGDEAEILFHDETETPIAVEMAPFVELEITYTEPGVKGDTATGATKPATVETGAEIQVPLFIDQGEKVRIDTRTKAYVERVKK